MPISSPSSSACSASSSAAWPVCNRTSGRHRWSDRSSATVAAHASPCAGMSNTSDWTSAFAPRPARTSSPSSIARFWYSPCSRSCARCRRSCGRWKTPRPSAMSNCFMAAPAPYWCVTLRLWARPIWRACRHSAWPRLRSSGCMASARRSRSSPSRTWVTACSAGICSWPTGPAILFRSMRRSTRRWSPRR
ncbi:hypothetical protein D9M68_810330 [compost metagenome]